MFVKALLTSVCCAIVGLMVVVSTAPEVWWIGGLAGLAVGTLMYTLPTMIRYAPMVWCAIAAWHVRANYRRIAATFVLCLVAIAILICDVGLLFMGTIGGLNYLVSLMGVPPGPAPISIDPALARSVAGLSS